MAKIEENNQIIQTEENKPEEIKLEERKEKNNFVPKTLRKERKNNERKSFSSYLEREVLKTYRPVKVTKGGRQFHHTALVLVKDKEKKSISYAHEGGKERMIALQKAYRKAQKNLTDYFPNRPHTIPRDIEVKYNSTKLILKPAPLGSGIKAGETLTKIFKYLEIKDVSAKIIGSRNKLNVTRAIFLALEKLTQKK
jgi:small subunit ribosomal protein S5